MKSYWSLVSARFRTLLQYRGAAIAGCGTQLFWGLIRVMIFDAFYRSSSATQPMAYPDVVTYIWLGQALFGMLPWNADRDIRTMVREGTVVYELLRPVDLYAYWFTRSLANRTAPTLLRALPLFLVAGAFLGLQPPDSWPAAIAWIVASAGALLLSCALSTLINISLLWTISGDGVQHLLPSALWVLSGMLVPLPFFPDWAQTIIAFMPFRGLVDLPFRLYSGHIPPSQAASVLAHQVAWSLGLILLGHRLLARGTRRLVVQGG